MRKQYHFRPSANGYSAWDIDRLIKLSSELEKQRVLLSETETGTCKQIEQCEKQS